MVLYKKYEPSVNEGWVVKKSSSLLTFYRHKVKKVDNCEQAVLKFINDVYQQLYI